MRNTSTFVSFIALIGILTFSFDAFAQRCRSGRCGGNSSGNFGRTGSTLGKGAFTKRDMGSREKQLTLLASPIARPGDIDITANVTMPGGLMFAKLGDEFEPRFSLGGAYGVTDEIELGGYLLGTDYNGDFRDPILWGLFTFGEDDADYGIRVGSRLPFSETTDFNLHIATPTKIGFDGGMLDMAVSLDLIFGDEISTVLTVPFRLAFNLNRELFFGVQSAVVMPEFDTDFLIMPLGFSLGYSIFQDRRPIIDIGAAFNFPLFLSPDFETGEGKAVFTDFYEIGIGLDFSHRF